jgi:hypothetical protein
MEPSDGQIRNPNLEIRNKSEIRISKPKQIRAEKRHFRFELLYLGNSDLFRISRFGFRLSGFRLRISDLEPSATPPQFAIMA